MSMLGVLNQSSTLQIEAKQALPNVPWSVYFMHGFPFVLALVATSFAWKTIKVKQVV